MGWALTQPLMKISVSTGHKHFGLIFWQLAVMSFALAIINLARRKPLPLAPRYLVRYCLIALIGTLIPNSITYQAAVHLPAGLLSIIISLVPMFALLMAIGIRMERFSPIRSLGVVFGAIAMILLIAPSESLPDPTMAGWIAILAISPFMYALEGTWVAKYGILDLDPVSLLLGASLVGFVVALPLAISTKQWVDMSQPWGKAEWALHGSSLIHAFIYSAYVWLVRRAGSVFASQVSYLVTGFGVVFAILILGETYSYWVWTALVVMLAGLFLVQPRGAESLVVACDTSDNGT